MTGPARPCAGHRWAVVGGGMLGLTLARRLRERGHAVTLYEAAPHLGGLASAWRLGDVVWDRHYHVTLLSDAFTRGALAGLGLEEQMRWVETRTGYYSDGRLASVSNTVEFLRLPGLRLVDKLRLGGTILLGSRLRDWRRLEEVPVADWLTRWSGRRTFERFWLPLLRSKLGESYRDASAAFIWATIQRLYAARRTGLKKEMFGYVPGGYARVLERYGEALAEAGVRVELASPVEQVGSEGGELVVRPAGGAPGRYDRVVVTANAHLASRMCPQLSADERDRLDGVRYQGLVCASLLLERPLADHYLTYITDDVPFTAVVEMSAFVDPDQFGGRTLVYLPKYVAPDDPFLSCSDDEVRERFLPALAAMYPGFSADDVLAFGVSRVREVFPVPTLGYSRRVPPVRTSVPGLFLVTSAHIVNGTLNVDETVGLAERAIDTLDPPDLPAPAEGAAAARP
ncbi:MAG: NAD(P)/FAD-dependent oxidoreductase [Acidimicrobiia bacterium]|nr:NAD(P)/FAD-dependent oxidoreductase [Acidimicrobiia bacterium]